VFILFHALVSQYNAHHLTVSAARKVLFSRQIIVQLLCFAVIDDEDTPFADCDAFITARFLLHNFSK
jgi:hypothetical protein